MLGCRMVRTCLILPLSLGYSHFKGKGSDHVMALMLYAESADETPNVARFWMDF